ncbi:MAG: hypothetical protein U5J83_08310 [Bryobacterales bacterium]|nr:hypothetical protein [Bryobacterales bacterium]
MRNMLKTLFLATCMVTANAWSADAGKAASEMDVFREKLRGVEQKAVEIQNLVKSRSATAESVRAEIMLSSVQELRAYVNENGEALHLNDPKRKFIVETTAQMIEIFVDNKLRVIDERDFNKSRGLIRDKAKGIVQRVKNIEKNIS